MNYRFAALIFIGLVSWGCSPCTNLQQKDLRIQEQFDELVSKDKESNVYLIKLKALRVKETSLLDQVRNCDIVDPQEYNYWYGNRLKYPSRIEMELNRLQQKQKRP